jgi:DDE superfamily endonuclease
MAALAVHPTDLRKRTLSAGRTGIDGAALTELCTELFSSLPRSDQRRKGEVYVRGLLATTGRKSIRKLAALSGGQADEQSLHHFVCSSTWDWTTIREALARHVVHAVPVRAWVVRPMVTPKAGEHSVGVDRKFSADAGHMLNAQQAVGVWAASDELSFPVNWRLHLPAAWTEDSARRSRAAVPEDVGMETFGDCAVAAYLQMAGSWGLPVRPVVMDARRTDALSAVRRLRASGLPMLIRVDGSQPLVPAGDLLPGRGSEAVSGQRILSAVRDRRRPVFERGTGRLTSLAAVVPVQMPATDAGRGLSLLGEWESNQPAPSALWLTDLTTADPTSLIRFSRLIRRVDVDFDRIADRVGIRDYLGRSFDGWHRHVTLASVAHAAASFAGRTADRELRYAS